ncbi:MAG TPA: FHA domain-containing protein [Thermoanaerobaculia bacterium]|nr:FHA domain-containing protein [Thermoanaerobaculia bacterium]
MADKRCENGHFIDESWDLCPYCPAESGEQDIAVVRPARAVPPSAPAVEPSRPVTAVPGVPRRQTPQPVQAPPPVQTPPMERTVAVPKAVDPAAQTKRYVVGWLVGLNGTSRGESFAIRIGRNVLGRDRRSDIVVSDDQASSHHADLVFRPEERRFILMDHNSTNGTYVNEVEIEPRRDLIGQDVIRIGSQKFLFMPLIQDGFYWDDEGALK